ncbi:MAG TPA: type II toxin-antitoxin system PemK/MazF family toxin, partial [Chitinophagales bacterium]|nr:type II toxin-antitoxin system PemK/MazF family toxin [Chitinophagales bacterium]
MPNTYTKGDVINVDLGSPPAEIKGHEQAYIRPCIVITAFEQLGLVIVIPLTSSKPKFNLYTVVKILQNEGGLRSDSYALCHQIRTISFDRILDIKG